MLLKLKNFIVNIPEYVAVLRSTMTTWKRTHNLESLKKNLKF
jgi:hypothetical protein